MYSDIPKIKQEANRLATKALDIHANVIFLVPAKDAELNALPYGKEIAQRLKRAGHKLDSDKPFVTDLPNPNATRVAIAGIDTASSAFELLTPARQLAPAH